MIKLNYLLVTCFCALNIVASASNANPVFAISQNRKLEPIKSPKKTKPVLTNYNNGTLEITFTSIKSSKGEVCVNLFNGSNGFPQGGKGAGLKVARCTPIVKGVAKISFANLPYGNYAVAAVHDTNGDNRLNSNFLGIPQEGFGFSNNPVVKTSPPSFSEAQFFISGSKTEIQVRMQYL
jgi:uncharacterized protein (DUF2141 family)